MARSMWRGAVQFGLVTIPVKLYLATESNAGLSFNLLHKTCLTRVQMRTWCPYHEEYISRADTVRGFEYAKGQYVVIDDADLENVPLKTVRSIEIETFVPARGDGEAARFVKSAYYLEPEPIGRKAFYLLQDVLREDGLSAICKIVIKDREALAAIDPYQRTMLLSTLYWPDEVRSVEELDLPDEQQTFKPAEVAMATQPGGGHDHPVRLDAVPRRVPRRAAQGHRRQGGRRGGGAAGRGGPGHRQAGRPDERARGERRSRAGVAVGTGGRRDDPGRCGRADRRPFARPRRAPSPGPRPVSPRPRRPRWPRRRRLRRVGASRPSTADRRSSLVPDEGQLSLDLGGAPAAPPASGSKRRARFRPMEPIVGDGPFDDPGYRFEPWWPGPACWSPWPRAPSDWTHATWPIRSRRSRRCARSPTSCRASDRTCWTGRSSSSMATGGPTATCCASASRGPRCATATPAFVASDLLMAGGRGPDAAALPDASRAAGRPPPGGGLVHGRARLRRGGPRRRGQALESMG